MIDTFGHVSGRKLAPLAKSSAGRWWDSSCECRIIGAGDDRRGFHNAF